MKYFSIEELSRSATAAAKGIDNRPTPEVAKALMELVDNVLDPLRQAWGGPIKVTSGYRCPQLNKAVGGAPRSQHVTGHTADITAGTRGANSRLFQLVKTLHLPFDQLIWEMGTPAGPDWIHISYDPRRSRRSVLHLY